MSRPYEPTRLEIVRGRAIVDCEKQRTSRWLPILNPFFGKDELRASVSMRLAARARRAG